MKNALYFWLVAGGLAWGEGSGNPTWDNEAEDLAGNPNSSFHADDNWNPDAVPGATDDVCILEHTDAANPVKLSSTSVELNSIVCKVPFQLSETLILKAASEFENSLIALGSGRIRTSGVVTFKGTNNLTRQALEGTGGFFNEGSVTIGSKGISTPFINQGEVLMVAALSRLGEFENNGLLDLGEKGHVNSATTLTNFGTIRKDNVSADSFISANLFMKSGLIEVTAGNFLEISGVEQEFEGGILKVDGELLLSTSVGGTPVRVFKGLPEITGQGSVRMTRPYSIENNLSNKLVNAPGLTPNDLNFGRPAPELETATLTNEGYLTITGTPEFLPANSGVSGNRFTNGAFGQVEQVSASNPGFGVLVVNEGIWTASSMRVSDFVNFNTLILKGDHTINPLVPSEVSSFCNDGGGVVTLPAGGTFNRYRVLTNYNQSHSSETRLQDGILILRGGSAALGGNFTIDGPSEMRMEIGPFNLADDLDFSGEGKLMIGGSQLNPAIQVADDLDEPFFLTMKFDLGRMGEGFDTSKGTHFRTGAIDMAGMDVENRGYFKWSGGRIEVAKFDNKGRMDTGAGVPRTLIAKLSNRAGGGAGFAGGIFQESAITMGTSFSEKGSIVNEGLHELYSGASIVGGATYEYLNEKLLRCRGTSSVTLSCEVENQGLIEVRENSALSLPFLKNLSAAGVLRGGDYAVEDGSTLILAEDVTVFQDATWRGEGLRKVESLKGSQTRVTKTSTETHTSELTCSEGATLECEKDCVINIPACEFESGAYFVGQGRLNTSTGPTLVRDATIAPGDEEEETGTLTVGGDLELEEEATYECDVASDAEHDAVVVETGQVVLGGGLQVAFLGDYTPAIGVSFVIFQGTSFSGTFDRLDQSALPPGLAPSVSYGTNSVSVSFLPQTLGTYDAWKQTRFTPAELADVLVSGPDADPDGDGQSNAEEYAHGLNPKKSEPSPVEIVAATSSTMDLRFPWATGTEASFQALTSSELTGLLARSSTELSSEPLAPGVNLVTIRVSFAEADEQFGRLVVSLP